MIGVFPDRRLRPQRPHLARGDAVFVDLGGGKNLVALAGACRQKTIDLDGMNYVALRAYKAAGSDVSFNEMSRMTGTVPVTGALVPVLVTFADAADAATRAHGAAGSSRSGARPRFHLHGVSAEVMPNGFWPLDFGGPLGEPVTRGIEAKLPWLNGAGRCRGDCAAGGGIAGHRGDRCQGGVHAKIAWQLRGSSADIAPPRRGRHYAPAIIRDPEVLARNDSGIFAMRRPVVGVIGNAYRIENRFPTQMVGERNLRAVAEVAGALPLMFAGSPEITDIGALLDMVDGVVLTGARANVHPTRFHDRGASQSRAL